MSRFGQGKVIPHPAWGLREAQQQQRLDRAIAADREIRISDFVIFALLGLRTVTVAGFPVNELASAALVALCLVRKPTPGAKVTTPVALIGAAILALLLFSGVQNEVDWTRRVGHLGIWLGLIWALTTGRISTRSAGLGALTGVLAIGGLALLGVGPDQYPGRLTGFFGDPNAAAYFVLVLGALGLGFVRRRWLRALAATALATIVVLTYSRTGVFGLVFGGIWTFLGRRLGLIGGGAMVAGLAWVVAHIPDDLRLLGPFSDRTGSDALRERIIAREHELIASAPWYGHGPGTATVQVADNTFFFHNSFLATRQEGGWLLLILVLALMAIAFVRLAPLSRAGDPAAIGTQVALLCVLVMAVTLGEVFLELPTAVAIGFGLRLGAGPLTPDIPSPPGVRR